MDQRVQHVVSFIRNDYQRKLILREMAATAPQSPARGPDVSSFGSGALKGFMSAAKSINLLNRPTNHFGTGALHPVLAGLASPAQRGRTYDRRLLKVLMLVEDNLRRQLVVGELAAAVNLSSGRLAHLFTSEFGVSPQRYLNHLRLAKAKELLENGMLSVKEIAAEVGFPNPSRFCRSFKARYGTTPKEYHKRHLRLDLKDMDACADSAQERTPVRVPAKL